MYETSMKTGMVRRMKRLLDYLDSAGPRLALCEFSFSSALRRSSTTAVCMLLGALGLGNFANAQNIITYDAPGAGTGPGQGTFGIVINPAKGIEGYYVDSNNVSHGFVRSPLGTITTFDAPGAGTGSGQGTLPFSLSPRGEITGYYTDASGLSHGFARAHDGTFTTFDAPGAGIGGCSPPLICSTGTQGASINAKGAIAGQYVDNSGVFHAFLRSPGGTITAFDAPGAGTGSGQGTYITFADGINPEGAISGGYLDSNNVFHGFLRAPDGAFSTFDPQGSVLTDTAGIDPEGTTTGFYVDNNGVLHGFVRSPDGTITTFDVPSGGTGSGQGTYPENINSEGDITGQYIDASGVNHGFLRLKSGAITTFDVSGAGTGSGQGTIPISNNPANAISGFYIDASGVAHGFLRPHPEQDGDRD